MEKNVCIVQLFNSHEKDKGLAYINSFDFAHTVREKELKKASAIQVSYSIPGKFLTSKYKGDNDGVMWKDS